MHALASLQSLFSTLWVVWFFVLFTGIILYVMAPRRKGTYERAGDIPFRDEDAAPSARKRS
ncbi:cbb3-type cytochrome oxidase subunit 3 [Falsiroseomonas sp. CW058]|uniref:cbb3-type cytochrome oxidase subunit 3 n=1 Tax=Falsiroseomonas sp. CW058 TaxID=3388664 RepID=UPI003D31DE13